MTYEEAFEQKGIIVPKFSWTSKDWCGPSLNLNKETKKRRNKETKKHRNLETETKKHRNKESKVQRNIGI